MNAKTAGTANFGTVATTDFLTDVSKGVADGNSAVLFHGYNGGLTAGVEEDLWCGGGYVTFSYHRANYLGCQFKC